MSNIKSNRIYIRVTPAEKEMILLKAQKAKMSISDYIINLTERKRIIVATGLPELIVETARIGNNINQIAHVLNTQKYSNKDLAELVVKRQNELINMVTNFTNKVLEQSPPEIEVSPTSINYRLEKIEEQLVDIKNIIDRGD